MPKSVLCSPITARQTHTKVTTEGTLSGFQEFSLQPIIKDRPNKKLLNPTHSVQCNLKFFSGMRMYLLVLYLYVLCGRDHDIWMISCRIKSVCSIPIRVTVLKNIISISGYPDNHMDVFSFIRHLLFTNCAFFLLHFD